MSHMRTSMPAAFTPARVASRTASASRSNCGSKCTVHAESMMRPFTCVPKSILHTSPYCSTVLSPEFGVQCAATWLIEQPVGKAMPAFRPFSCTSLRLRFSSCSHMSVIRIPGFTIVCMCLRTCRWHSAAVRTSLYEMLCSRSSSRSSADVVRYRLSPSYSTSLPCGSSPDGNCSSTGMDGGVVCGLPPGPGFGYAPHRPIPRICVSHPPFTSNTGTVVSPSPVSPAAFFRAAAAFFLSRFFWASLLSPLAPSPVSPSAPSPAPSSSAGAALEGSISCGALISALAPSGASAVTFFFFFFFLASPPLSTSPASSSSSSSSSRRSTFICSSFITSVHSVIVILPSASASIRSSHRLKAASSGFFAGSSCSIAWVQATRTGTTRGAYCLGWASRKIRAAG
mmetsp:Transcript_29610/g.62000  ORF Transcript_29610/g.62000 Transcript_29610/m.62000 type:complete len:398 (+) Transcript_29610:1077-2270(+)